MAFVHTGPMIPNTAFFGGQREPHSPFFINEKVGLVQALMCGHVLSVEKLNGFLFKKKQHPPIIMKPIAGLWDG